MAQLEINSKDRYNYSTTSSSAPLTLQFSTTLDGKYFLSYGAFPRLGYGITSYNNTISFHDTADRTATLPVGVYTATTLAAALKVALDGAPGSVNTYTVTLSIGNVLTIASTGNYSMNFTLGPARYQGNAPNATIGSILGFGNIQTATATTLTATGAVNLNWDLIWYVHISGANVLSDSTYIAQAKAAEVTTTFTIGTANAAAGAVVEYTPRGRKQPVTFQGDRANAVTVNITDATGNYVNFGGADWTMTLEKCD
jgi:hypothetical protein